MSEGAPLLAVRGIGKTFGSTRSLDDVSFEIFRGEIVALVGDNGAGKSTLVKSLSGSVVPDQGSLTFEGKEAAIREPRDAARLGIATVYQDLALCDNLDVVENLFLGRELSNRFGILDEIAMEKRALALLATLDVKIPSVRSKVESLSGGQRQCIAVARAILADTKLVFLDEPTAALGVAQTEQVLNLVLRLKEQGHAVVVISHNMADVFRVADRILVLRLGKVVGDLRTSATTREEVIARMTGAFSALPGATS